MDEFDWFHLFSSDSFLAHNDYVTPTMNALNKLRHEISLIDGHPFYLTCPFNSSTLNALSIIQFVSRRCLMYRLSVGAPTHAWPTCLWRRMTHGCTCHALRGNKEYCIMEVDRRLQFCFQGELQVTPFLDS